MIKAIKEIAVIIETKEKNKKEARTNFWLEKERSEAIEETENLMAKKELKIYELGEDTDYKEKISNSDKKWKIRALRDEIIANIKKIINDKSLITYYL